MGINPSSPYPYIPVNDDDDNGNGLMDMSEPNQPKTSQDDDDLVPLALSVNSPRSSPDVVELALFQDTSALQVWNKQNRCGRLITSGDDHETWAPGSNWSKTVYVEGMYASAGLEGYDPKLAWRYWGESYPGVSLDGWNDNDGACKRQWTAVRVDMDMAGVADTGPTTQETTPGGFIPLNGWAQLTVMPVQPTSLSREVSLSVTNGGNGRIEVWNAGKTQQITAPFSPTADTTCWVTGTQVSSSLRDVTLCLTQTQTGFQDRINLTVVEVDLQAYKRDGAQISSTQEETRGAYLAYNNDDDDADGGGTTADKDDNSVAQEDDLIKVHFAFPPIFGSLEQGKVVIERSDTKIRLWRQQVKGADQEIVFQSNKKIYDLTDSAQRTEFRSYVRDKDLWLEGYSPSGVLRDTELKLEFTGSGDQEICKDIVKVTVFDTELKTYKRGGVELLMDKEKDPGNYIVYNNDDDNGDDTEDVLDTAATANEDDLQTVRFAFGGIFNDLQTGKVVIQRSSGSLKLWKQISRTSEIVFTGNEKIYDLSDAGQRTAFANDIRNRDLYVEGANKSAAMRDTEFTLKYVDSDNVDICKDLVKYTVSKIDLDVNADADTDDAVDGVVGYLPGYEGGSPKISGGASFAPQEMKIVVEPIDGAAIDTVALAIENVTAEIGFCMNAGTNPDTEHDYSFNSSSNSASVNSSIGGGKAIQAFFCKDYGASCGMKTQLKKGGVVLLEWTRTIPIDTNTNRIADCWDEDDKPNTSATWDAENAPNGNGTTGDGLTRYEEYRGFMTEGTHERTQARRKDLFIYRENAGYGAADLSTVADTHIVTADEMNGAYHDNQNGGQGSVRSTVGPRIVNFNYGTFAHSVLQHGLWIAVMPANDGAIGNWGLCRDNNGGTAGAVGSPETAGRIEVYEDNIRDAAGPVKGAFFSYDASARASEFIDDVIGHEGGHGVSVEHHGNLLPIAVTDYPGPSWLDCNTKSNYFHDRSCEAGSTSCITRYNFFDISAAVAGDLDKNGTPESPTDSDWTPTVTSCTGHCNPCLAQIDINDN